MKVRVEGVTFKYNSVDVLNDISFSVERGQVIGILGPNGSGKTTLLKLMNRILSPQRGAVMIDGTDCSTLSRKDMAMRIGGVPQNNEITTPFTVLDIVMMGRSAFLDRFQMEGREDIEAVKRAMRMTDVTRFADRSISKLSGGERQRVIIARALAQEPDVLLLDEPTLHLDVNHQLEILDLVTSLSREKGMTVVFVSHDLNLVARYCDKVILISDARIQAAGGVEKVLTQENMRKVFKIEAALDLDERVGGHIVTIIRSHRQ